MAGGWVIGRHRGVAMSILWTCRRACCRESSLIDVEAPNRFRTRLAGTDVCKDRGRELRGLLIEDIHHPDEVESVAAPLRGVVETWEPDLRRRRYRTATRIDHCYARLALPLSEDGQRVDGLLLASECVKIEAKNRPSPIPGIDFDGIGPLAR